MNKILKDACILFAITLVAGVLLGAVYEITKKPIADQNEKAKQAAYKAVMQDADSFEALADEKYNETNVTQTFSQLLINDEQNYEKDDITEVVAGVKNGRIVGFVITVVAHDGYAGDIRFSVGISNEGEYLGTSLLSISETAGLGMRAKTDPSFLEQFENKNVTRFNLVKDGTGETADEKIDAMSGSTVTSKAILRGINSALTAYGDLKSSNVKTAGGVSFE